ncbi:MAG: cell division protein ZapB [Nitrospirae bacterium]|nr:cell division protein ZapB [Nitrospirota bacterium]
MEKLKTLEDKIANAIDKVKTLKEEKMITERRVQELEGLLNEKNIEIEQLKAEKSLVKSQLEALLNEIEALEVE